MNQPPAAEPRPVPPVPTGFGPAKITILPLSDLVAIEQSETRLEVYVAVLDAFGSAIKTPAALRVELYEYTPRSPQPKGRRIAIWPDIDLTQPAENNRHWRDVLRAYYFEFDPNVDRDQTYVLEVTCLCPGGKRLSAEHAVRTGS